MKKLHLGMPTLIECQDIEQNVALCKELGLDFIEINMNLPQYQIEQINPEYYKSLMEEHNIFYTLHLPENLNIADFNPRVREAYLNTVVDSISLAKEIGIKLLNMHMVTGVYFTLPNQKVFLYDKDINDYIHSIKSFADLVNGLIGKENICVSIENTGLYNLNYIKSAVTQLLELECFKLTWDIGHDFSSGNMDTDYVLSNLSSVRHFHLHDAIGKNNHLPFGEGEMDLQSKIDIAKSNRCTCVIETKTIDGLKKSVDAIRKGKYIF